MKKLLAICFSIGLFLVACNKHNSENINIANGYEYFPIDSGLWIVYDVFEIDIDLPISKNDTSYYQIKRIFGKTLESDSTNTKRVCETYFRKQPTDKWQILNVGFVEKNAKHALIVENNSPIIKQKYPLENGKSWNGNIYNTLKAENYSVKNINQPYIINDKNFLETTCINEKYDSSLISLNNIYEVYAKNIGLIYSIDETINSQNMSNEFFVDMSLPIRKRIVIGKIIETKISDSGK